MQCSSELELSLLFTYPLTALLTSLT